MVLLAVFCAACGSSKPAAGWRPTTTVAGPTTSSTSPLPGAAPSLRSIAHIFVVLMENLGASQAMAVPSIAALAERYQSTPDFYAAAHPSLPNYLALVSGSTWGIDSDCTTCTVDGDNLGAQLSAADISWDAYFENIPSSCFLGPESPDGLYAEKHDPFAYFDDIRSSPVLCAHIEPFGDLTPLLSGPASGVPRFVWVTPNMCDDGHNCAPSVAGAWLSGFVSSVVASPAWRSGGMLIVTWDEGDTDAAMDPQTAVIAPSGGGGPVLALVVTPGAPAGRVLAGPYDDYSVLRTVEEAFGVPLLGQAAASGVQPLTAFLPSS
ncbi:MAG TPA: alkaline phosphatase family protein [Acidimicrobiales bacterium]|nr:alkaline phosphatase family protein [Acidimicrobiales bacterium]